MKYFNYIDLLFYVPLTFLMVYDYFPEWSMFNFIPREIYIWVILGLVIFSLFFKRLQTDNRLEIVYSQIFSLSYLLFLMIILTVFGGESLSGIGFDDIGTWIVIILSIAGIMSQKRKLQKEWLSLIINSKVRLEKLLCSINNEVGDFSPTSLWFDHELFLGIRSCSMTNINITVKKITSSTIDFG